VTPKYAGGKRRFDDEAIRRMHREGLGATEIARTLGCRSTTTVYRALGRKPKHANGKSHLGGSQHA
jgi:IS30 family transposase